ITLLFTRRIADPKWGVRLTGKDGPWAVGLLASDDASPGQVIPINDPLANRHAYFGVGRISRDIGPQSYIGAMYADRELARYFNRVGGIDGRLRLNSHWTTSFQGVLSSTLNVPDSTFLTTGAYQAGQAAELTVQRDGRKLNYFMDFTDRSNDFRTL